MNRLGCETRKSYSGFTLIELLVVIAIIAILAAILFPVFTAARERSKQAKCLSNVGQIAKAIIMYADDWNGMYLWNADFEDKDEFGGDYLNAPYPWVILLKYTAGKEIWACPSDKGLTWPATGPFDGKIRALTGPTVSIVSEMWTPYLKQLIAGYREMGFYTIKHTDGDIMPVLDQLIDCNPHALHSIDPQAGVDIAEVKRLYGDRVCLIGNVNCGLLDTGSEEDVVQSARYALQSGMPGYGYIFSTSNCIYTGMRLSRYELMLDVWRSEGNYAL
ncbi:MAG: uroporphyrinogen decarboxylase family protein [Armatimonadota bacterium]